MFTDFRSMMLARKEKRWTDDYNWNRQSEGEAKGKGEQRTNLHGRKSVVVATYVTSVAWPCKLRAAAEKTCFFLWIFAFRLRSKTAFERR